MQLASLSDNELAQIIWNFNTEIDQVEPADVILVLGSHDVRVAHRGIDLYEQGMAPLIIFSGGLGRLTSKAWTNPEAEIFTNEALKRGVPSNKILQEDKSTNTGENIIYSLKLLQEKGLNPNSFIVVHKPYMLRRAWATFQKHQPEKKVFVTAPQFTFENSPFDSISKKDVINIMVGDLQRLKIYPEKGFQVEVAIPDEVWACYEELVKRGYTEQLVN